MKAEFLLPSEIEKRSFEIIRQEIGERYVPEEQLPVVLRVIHTTADFDYLDNLYFSENAVDTALAAIREGALIVTDTNMALAGINKSALARHGCEAVCFMADKDVAETASANGTTRAVASVDKAAALGRRIIYAVGNAPTALMRICELYEAGKFRPEFVIGVPVGFVNVVHSKELLRDSGLPCIAAMGRKGGSTVAAAICNALLMTCR